MIVPKKWLALAIVLAAAVTICWLFFLGPNRPLQLPDGSIVRLEGVTFGTNRYIQGNSAQKLLARWLPSGRVPLLGTRLFEVSSRGISDINGDLLAVWISIKSNLEEEELQTQLNNKLRVVAFNNGGRQNEGSRNSPNKIGTKTFLVPLGFSAFPRDEPKVGIRLLWRGREGEWTTVGEFYVRNPVQTNAVSWTSEQVPLEKHYAEIEVELGKVLAGQGLMGESPFGFSNELWFKLTTNGIPTKRWQIVECVIRDAEGSFHYAYQTKSQGEWQIWQSRNSLNPKNTWKVQLTIAGQLGLSEKEVVSLHGISDASKKVWATNEFGIPVLAELAGNCLTVSLPTHPTDWQLIFLRTTNDLGQTSTRVLSPTQHEARQSLNSAPKSIDVTVAVHRNVSLEYFVKPSVVETTGGTF